MAKGNTKAPQFRKISKEKKSVKMESMTFDDRPRIGFSETELPEIKDWKNKGKYTLVIEVEQVGSHVSEHGPDTGKIKADFRINAVKSKS